MEITLLIPKGISRQFKKKSASNGVFVRFAAKFLLELAVSKIITVKPSVLAEAIEIDQAEADRLKIIPSGTNKFRAFHRLTIPNVTPAFLEEINSLSGEVGKHVYCTALMLTYLESLDFVVELREKNNEPKTN